MVAGEAFFPILRLRAQHFSHGLERRLGRESVSSVRESIAPGERDLWGLIDRACSRREMRRSGGVWERVVLSPGGAERQRVPYSPTQLPQREWVYVVAVRYG